MPTLSACVVLCSREEAEEKILKSAKQSGSGSLAAWEEELNDVNLERRERGSV